jgi:phage-related protein
VKQALNVLGTVFELGWTALKAIVGLAWDGIKTLVSNGIGKLVDFMQAIPGKFLSALSSLGSTLGGLFRDAMDAGKDKVVDIGATIIGWIAAIPGKLLDKLSDFKNAGASLIRGFVDGLKGAAGLVSDVAGNIWTAVQTLLNDAITKINSALEFTISVAGKGFTINPPDIPHLAKGGLVTRPTLALIGEDGPEAVVPLSRKHNPGGNMPSMGGGGSIQINIYGPTDPLAAAREVEKILLKLQRATGRPLAFSTAG